MCIIIILIFVALINKNFIMKNYFYIDKTTQQQKGPYSPEQLKLLNLQPNTMVWSTGMENWAEAQTVKELAHLFNKNSATNQQQVLNNANCIENQKDHNLHTVKPIPKNWLVESILSAVLCCPPFGIVAIVYATKVESYYNLGDYESAEDASKKAKMWTFIAAGSIVAFAIIYFIIILVVILIANIQ